MSNEIVRAEGPTEPCVDHPNLSVIDRNGAAYCFNCIIVESQNQAYNLACRMLTDRHLAEDAVQESLTAAYRSFAQFRGDNLRAWLMRIVANQCRDMLRYRRARPAVPLDPTSSAAYPEDTAPSVSDFPSSLESPEEAALRVELRDTIEGGLQAISHERRLAILLIDVQGFSYEEAASIMNCSVGTVKSRVSRGRRQLRDYLREYGELLPASFRQEQ